MMLTVPTAGVTGVPLVAEKVRVQGYKVRVAQYS